MFLRDQVMMFICTLVECDKETQFCVNSFLLIRNVWATNSQKFYDVAYLYIFFIEKWSYYHIWLLQDN